MLAKTSLREQMLAWLDTKNPNERYDWSNCLDCACGQFAWHIGRLKEWRSFAQGDGPVGKLDQEWGELNCIAGGDTYTDYFPNWTFGKMRDRLLEDASHDPDAY